jgi:alkylation response protein AidB-like acyl-CoA dehydrogenase
MNVKFNTQQNTLRKKIRGYLQELMTPALRAELDGNAHSGAEGGGPEFRRALEQMGSDGWIGMGWPEKLGGGGLTPLEQYIFTEEVLRIRFPYPFLTTDGVGPVLAEHGSEKMKDTVVKDIRAGKAIFAIGYSEPGAGTDLAALKTRAVPDKGGWLVNGQKIWTSLANFSDYIWLAARTDDDPRKRHKGLSIFVVPTSDKGYSCTAIHTLGDVRTNSTYYNDIRVPMENLVGEVNSGWRLITSQLNMERLSLVNHGYYEEMVSDLLDWACCTPLTGGGYLAEQTWVQTNFARLYSGLEALKLICWKQAWSMTYETLGMAEASAAKVYGSEFFIELARMMMEIQGEIGALCAGEEGAALGGRIERIYRTASILTFGGGANEIQRDIIAAAGLLLPRAKRS